MKFYQRYLKKVAKYLNKKIKGYNTLLVLVFVAKSQFGHRIFISLN